MNSFGSNPRTDLDQDLDPGFTFDYRALDDLADGQRFSTYWDVEPLMRGPQPAPEWLVTDRAAVDTDHGVLKTGKEAEVFVLERALDSGLGLPGPHTCLLAAKRYRGTEHSNFHRNADYTTGRRTRDSRVTRALAKKSSFGREVAAGQWAMAEWESLKRCWAAGVPVPYPVQIDGTEILMELVTVDGEPAPRLANTRPSPALLRSWFDQLRDAMTALAVRGLAHGDLSPYNILAAGDRIVVIDLPQVVDLVANPLGADLLQRDCHNVCTWFARRGLDVDEHALFAELMASAW
jgi:RIO kinase 1